MMTAIEIATKPAYRILRRIRHDLLRYVEFPSVPEDSEYSEWHRFGTRRDMELALAERLVECLRALAVDGRYQYAIFDEEGRMVQDETGRWLMVEDVASVA